MYVPLDTHNVHSKGIEQLSIWHIMGDPTFAPATIAPVLISPTTKS